MIGSAETTTQVKKSYDRSKIEATGKLNCGFLLHMDRHAPVTIAGHAVNVSTIVANFLDCLEQPAGVICSS
jgi:hypothetical protein